MKVVYVRHDVPAWNVIALAARIAARVLEADLVQIPSPVARHPARRVLRSLPRLRRGEAVFIIAPEPVDLYAALDLGVWASGPREVAAWVVDSWWDDRIPAVARQGRHVDRYYISEPENLSAWERATGRPVAWLPQGTDALGRGSGTADRSVVVQRLGRQPASWEDDEVNGAAAAAAGLSYRGRTPFVEGEEAGMTALLSALAQTRFVMAFSNAASPAPYTHPTREYLTGRWTDSLAAGATVAGIAPRCASTDLLWPGALVELSSTDLPAGIEAIAAENARWTPDRALANHLGALRSLDWRHRFASVARDLGRQSATLGVELDQLNARATALAAAGHWIPT